MESTKHAILSASTAHRWLKCIPSAYLESLEDLEECNVYAEEGTEAHTLAELKLKYEFNYLTKEDYEKLYKEFISNSKYYDKAFEEYVDTYVTYVIEQAKELGDDVIASFEVIVDFSKIVPDGFGTADTVLVSQSKHTIHVIDLKFGQGIPVTSKDNPQLMLYAVGVLNDYDEKNYNDIYITICQPRLYNIDTTKMSSKDLIDWAYEYVQPIAQKAIKGEGKLAPSESACRFCKLKGKCKARANMQLDIAQQEFDIKNIEANKVQNMSPERIGNILDVAQIFVDWFKDVQAYAMGQLLRGVKIPGYKLVEGRSVRIITDAEKVKEILLGIGLTEEMIMKPKELKGLSSLERLVGKKLFSELCADYLVKPMGKVSMVPVSDSRQEINSIEIANRDFSTINEEE